MLNTVLDRLSGLTSKYFIVSAFIPVLAFGAVNGLLWNSVYGGSGRWTNAATLSQKGTDLALVLFALAIVAYILWSLNGFLRSVLEGQTLWPAIAGLLKKNQQRQINTWWDEYNSARNQRIAMTAADWQERLDAAAIKGQQAHAGHSSYVGRGPAADGLKGLIEARRNSEALTHPDIEQVVRLFITELEANDTNTSPAGGKDWLGDDLQALLTIFQEAGDDWTSREVGHARRLQLRTGERELAPTAFGNVAMSMNGYARGRYGMDLPTFWSRLQPLLPEHAAFHGSLQDAKAQVDFLVLSVWLSALTFAFWIAALPATSHWKTFLAVAAVGPLLTRLLYRAAIESYMAFAELVRTAVDLYRFDLLKAMHLPVPSRLGQERELWTTLGRVLSFGHDWIDVSFTHRPDDKK